MGGLVVPSGVYDEKTRFAVAVLKQLGAPASSRNIAFMLTWFKREGTRAKFNPLATTLKYGSYGKDLNSVGVKNYADFDTGVGATVATLLGKNRYMGIVEDLRRDDPDSAARNHPKEWGLWSGGGYTSLNFSSGAVGTELGGNLGTGSAGASGDGTGANVLSPSASPDEIDKYIRENDPSLAGLLDVPEIRTILIQYAQDKDDGVVWPPNVLTSRIAATNWYKEHGATFRTNYQLKTTDPGTWEADVQAEMARLRPDFNQLGSDVSLRAIAEASLLYGWNEQQLRENFAGHLQYDKEHTGLKGGAKLSADELTRIARNDYMVPMLRQDVEQWVVDITAGKRTLEQYKDFLADIAEARFPGLKERGVTPGDYMAPVRNAIAEQLELNPADIDLLSPKYSAVLQVSGDGKTPPRAMTFTEAQKWARDQEEYKYTNGARDEAASFVDFLGQRFGMSA